MTCEACAESRERVTHTFHATCRGCIARGVARGPEFHASKLARVLTRGYLDQLMRLELSHLEVVAAHEADFMGRSA